MQATPEKIKKSPIWSSWPPTYVYKRTTCDVLNSVSLMVLTVCNVPNCLDYQLLFIHKRSQKKTTPRQARTNLFRHWKWFLIRNNKDYLLIQLCRETFWIFSVVFSERGASRHFTRQQCNLAKRRNKAKASKLSSSQGQTGRLTFLNVSVQVDKSLSQVIWDKTWHWMPTSLGGASTE